MTRPCIVVGRPQPGRQGGTRERGSERIRESVQDKTGRAGTFFSGVWLKTAAAAATVQRSFGGSPTCTRTSLVGGEHNVKLAELRVCHPDSLPPYAVRVVTPTAASPVPPPRRRRCRPGPAPAPLPNSSGLLSLTAISSLHRPAASPGRGAPAAATTAFGIGELCCRCRRGCGFRCRRGCRSLLAGCWRRRRRRERLALAPGGGGRSRIRAHANVLRLQKERRRKACGRAGNSSVGFGRTRVKWLDNSG